MKGLIIGYCIVARGNGLILDILTFSNNTSFTNFFDKI